MERFSQVEIPDDLPPLEWIPGCEPLGWIEKALGWIEKVLMLFGFLTVGLYRLFKFLFSIFKILSFVALTLVKLGWVCRGKGKTQATRFFKLQF